MAERGIGDNRPRVELTDEEAEFVRGVLDRDIQQSMTILQMVQDGTLSEAAAVSAVDYTEKARPIWKKLKEHLE